MSKKTKDPKNKSTNFKSNKNNGSSKSKLIKPNNKVNKNKEKSFTTKNLNKSSRNLESEKNNFNRNSNSFKFSECATPDNKDKDNKKDLNMNNTSDENTNLSNKNKESLNIGNNNNLLDQNSNLNLNNNRTSINSSSVNLTNNNSSNKLGFNSNNLNEYRNSIKDNNDICALSQTKLVNRKDDKTFINEKMVIKPDPNKSIFKSIPNPAFFNQANKKSNDIVIVSKGEPSKFNSINNNNNLHMIEEKGKDNKKDMNNNNINEKIPKNINKKDNSKKILPNKKDKQNNDSEAREKKVINEQFIKNNNNIQNEMKKTNEYNKKENEEMPHIKNKFAPLIENKIKTTKGNEQHIVSKISDKKNNYKNYENIHEDNIDDFEMNKNKNKFEKISTNKDNEIKIKTYDPNIINTLLSQMNSLSKKQLSLIDIMDNVHMETQGQIKDLNKKLSKLERSMEDLNNEFYYIKNDN